MITIHLIEKRVVGEQTLTTLEVNGKEIQFTNKTLQGRFRHLLNSRELKAVSWFVNCDREIKSTVINENNL